MIKTLKLKPLRASMRGWMCGAAIMAMASLSACSQAPYQQAMSTSSSASMVTAQARGVSAQANSLVSSLKALTTTTGALNKPYANFTSALAGFKSSFSSLKGRIATMLGHQKAYLASWNKENNSISNASIKKVAMARYNAAAGDFANVQKQSDSVITSGDSFVTYMDDLNTYLSTDLNSSGLASGEPLFSKADTKAAALKSDLATLETGMKKVSADFATSGHPAAPVAKPKSSGWW